ncbi:hypothetical protein GCM10023331_05120 [Algivirga pacifica]|uniref:RlpA-like protein double-psi beta-barrel domain-containing protein n=2 Tax=Algivirga pacifica TaxID=1162670 RepID=A0ABP9D123_9BACT
MAQTTTGRATFTAIPDGSITASGEKYDRNELTAAHATLPFGTKLKVHNNDNGKEITVKINDRTQNPANLLELTYMAAYQLNMLGKTYSDISVQVMDNGNGIKNAVPFVSQQSTPEFKDEYLMQFSTEGFYTLEGIPISPKGYGVQVSASTNKEYTLEKAVEYHKMMFRDLIIQVSWVNQQKIYRLFIGAYLQPKEAVPLQKFFNQNKIGAHIKAYEAFDY